MIHLDKKEQCCGCSSCSLKCPVKAIKMQPDTEGFLYPVIDTAVCIQCGLCEKVCPVNFPVPTSDHTEVFACYRKDFEKRLKSASGGVFAVLAEAVLAQGGKVFGAAFDEEFYLRHQMAANEAELSPLLGSKYVQSEMRDTFAQVKRELQAGVRVLFSGTPCQVQGLERYLGRSYSNLITVDLICHGVSSPEVWKDYLHEISGGKKIISFIPRDKTDGITDAPLVFHFDDGSILNENYSDNLFIRGFSRNLYLRPSCYFCPFKGVERCSDITLGDFWGLERYAPEFGDRFGISCVLLHTAAGRELFSQIQHLLVLKPASAEQILPSNPCLIAPVEKTDKREAFFNARKSQSMTASVKQILRPGLRETGCHILHEGKCYIDVARHKIKKLLKGSLWNLLCL